MLREVFIPDGEYVQVRIPKEYINQKIELIAFPLDEKKDKVEKKFAPDWETLSSVFGKLEWDGDAVEEQEKLRDEWE